MYFIKKWIFYRYYPCVLVSISIVLCNIITPSLINAFDYLTIIAPVEVTGKLNIVHNDDKIGTLIGADMGLFRITEVGKLERMAPFEFTDRIFDIQKDEKSGIVIYASKGLFKITKAGLLKQIASLEVTDRIFEFQRDDKSRLLIYATEGLFKINNAGELEQIAPKSVTGEINEFYKDEKFGLLIYAIEGLFKINNAGELKQIAPKSVTGKINEFYKDDKFGLLIGAVEGLFMITEEGKLEQIAPVEVTGGIYDFSKADKLGTLIDAGKGLFRITDVGMLEQIAPVEVTGEIDQFYRDDKLGLFIDAREGLFRITDSGILKQITPVEVTGGIYRFIKSVKLGLLIDAREGLFRMAAAEELEQLAPVEEIGEIFSYNPHSYLPYNFRGIFEFDKDDKNRLLIISSNGLFRITEAGRPEQIAPVEVTGRIDDFYQDKKLGLLINAEKGFYRITDEGELDQIAPVEVTGLIYKKIHKDDKFGVLIGATNGLLKVTDADNLEQIAPASAIGQINGFYSYDKLGLLVHTNFGLFRYCQTSISEINARRLEDLVEVNTGTKITLNWEINIVLPSGVNRLELVDAANQNLPIKTSGRIRIRENNNDGYVVTAEITPQKKGVMNVALAIYEKGKLNKFGGDGPVAIRVDWSINDYLLHLLKISWKPILASHTIIFLGLFFAARWSSRALLIISNPKWWGKAGLWFYLAWHFKFFQYWILEKWFTRQRRVLSKKSYLPVILYTLGGPEKDSAAILDILKNESQIWIVGKAGMGKTALLEHIAFSFFCNPEIKTFKAAFKRYNFIPIIVSLRDFHEIKPNSKNPTNWVPELAAASLSSQTITIEDIEIIKIILNSPGYVLVLDGANEIEYSEELESFAHRNQSVRLLITSQAKPTEKNALFKIYQLPNTLIEYLEPLLSLYLDNELGHEVAQHVASSELIASVKSGYDIRLIADLAKDLKDLESLPNSQIGLYETILNQLVGIGMNEFPLSELCQIAWNLWRDGERKFKDCGEIPTDIIDPLRQEGQKIVRTYDGVNYSFRHDQMRGYLAARWAAHHEVSPIKLFQQSNGIWRLDIEEQMVVWTFFAAMVDQEQGVELWRWATQDPERVILQHALQERGQAEGWHFKIE
jgi:hypothetical protein